MLPYKDNKPVGAADFYFAINATFRFIRTKFGDDGLVRYWSDLGRRYFHPVTELWKKGGVEAVRAYWNDFFAAEPGADVFVEITEEAVQVTVRCCPAIRHLRQGKRHIEKHFCRHCYFVSEAMAAPAGLTVRVEGGNGTCRQSFHAHHAAGPQQLSAIHDCQ